MHKISYFILKKFKILDILANQERQNCILEEIRKAEIFNSTIADSKWLKFKSFSPGGWAADYGLLYTLYRVLDGMRPQNILEFGLGQSSKIIHQYSNHFKIKAITVEHDENWINFFNKSKDGDYNINIQRAELDNILYKGKKTQTYKDLISIFSSQKFDLILVDGPLGQDHYSRPQIIDMLKDNLSEQFCIILDDYGRIGEQETGKEVLQYLHNKNIKFHQRIYSSEKQHLLICSNDLKFLTSL